MNISIAILFKKQPSEYSFNLSCGTVGKSVEKSGFNVDICIYYTHKLWDNIGKVISKLIIYNFSCYKIILHYPFPFLSVCKRQNREYFDMGCQVSWAILYMYMYFIITDSFCIRKKSHLW
jgi:hypothetical protein